MSKRDLRLPQVSFAILSSLGTISAAQATECRSLYKHPAVQKVVAEHVARATKARQTDPSLSYDVAKNLDLLSERVTTALRTDYIENSDYPGTRQSKQREAVEATMELGMDALIGCFPSYRAMYAQFIEPQQSRKEAARPSPDGTAPSAMVAACAPVFQHRVAQTIVTEISNDLADILNRNNTTPPPVEAAAKEVSRKLWFKLNSDQPSANERAAWERALDDVAKLDLPTVKRCFPQFAVAADKVAAEWAVIKSERDKKQAEEAAAREQQRQRTASREQEQRDKEARAQADAKTPSGILRRAYEDYVYVGLCQKERQGYAVVHIAPPEMEEARRSVKLIEEKMTAAHRDLDKDALWSQAAQVKIEIGDRYRMAASMFTNLGPEAQRTACQLALSNLRSTLKEISPSAGLPKKDF